MFLPKLDNLPRMTRTAMLAAMLLVVVILLAPQQLGVIVYKIALVFLAGVSGYILDRALFPYARPDRFISKPIPLNNPVDEIVRGRETWESRVSFLVAQARRAVIVSAAMLAVGLGL